VQLTAGEQERVKRPPTTNLEAYDCFLRGLEYHAYRTQESNGRARQMFERAIELDPHFAAAYALLGLTYLAELTFQWDQSPQVIEKLLALAQQAVTLDDSQPVAYEALAYAYLGKKQHDQAIAAAERAIGLDPNSADAYQTLGDILSFAGRPQEAVTLIEKAMRLNPRYTASYLWSLGQAYRLVGRTGDAINVLQRTVLRNPDHITAHMMLAVTFVELGRLPEAQAEAATILRVNPRFSLAVVEARMPYKDPSQLERVISHLRQAGLQ
jgi:adenylate cyclase